MTAKSTSSKAASPAKGEKKDVEANEPRTITLQTKDGEVEWVPISERRKLFEQRFPFPEYREEIDVQIWDNPVGYVLITARCKRYPKEGEPYTVKERHAFGFVLQEYKSFERIETSAVGRLYTALGIEGQTFDDEEKTDALKVDEAMPWETPEYQNRQGAKSSNQGRSSGSRPTQARPQQTTGRKTHSRIRGGFPTMNDSPEKIGEAMAEELEGRTH